MLQFLKGHNLKNKVRHPQDAMWDLRWRIGTFGYVPAVGEYSDPDWRGLYLPTTYRELFDMLRHVSVNASDVFLDLGSGLGRAVFAAKFLGAKRAIGVEIDPGLCNASIANLEKFALGQEGIEFHCGGAEGFAPRDCTVIFVYNAFGPNTLGRVLDNLHTDIKRNPRQVRLVYFNPSYDDIVEKAGFLTRFDHWPKPPHRHPTSFWQTR
jgi:SAM-dependent methyltransferase